MSKLQFCLCCLCLWDLRVDSSDSPLQCMSSPECYRVFWGISQSAEAHVNVLITTLEGNSYPSSVSGVIWAQCKLCSSFCCRGCQSKVMHLEKNFSVQTNYLPKTGFFHLDSIAQSPVITSSQPFESPKPFHCGLWLHLTFV